MIFEDEIDQANDPTVAQLVERLRPTWVSYPMTRRGPDTLLEWSSPPNGGVRRLAFACAATPCFNRGGSTPTSDVKRLRLVRKGVVLMYFGDEETDVQWRPLLPPTVKESRE